MRQAVTPCRGAAKAHAHGQGLFAVGPRFLEKAVQVKGYPRQVAKISRRVKRGKKMAIGGSMTDTTQARQR